MPTNNVEWFVIRVKPEWYAIGYDGVALSGIRVIELTSERFESIFEAVAAVLRRREQP